MEISEVNPDGNVYQIKDATARTEIAQIKAQSVYSTEETDTGMKWIDGSTIYKKVILTGALPNAAKKNISHGISSLKYIISLSGMTYNPTTRSYFTLPFCETGDSPIGLQADATNVSVTTHVDRRSFTTGYITMLYIKN